MDINKVLLYGRLVADPELKKSKSGSTSFTNIRVATNKSVKDKDGEREQIAEFHTVVAFGKQAEVICKHFVKGQKIYVEGALQTRSWEADGVTHYRTQIILDGFEFGEKPSQKGQAKTSSEAVVSQPEETVTA